MELTLPVEPLSILHTLQSHGYEGYIVGGAVRDLLRAQITHEQVTDFDFTTNATPEQILSIFPNSFYENQFGTVSITPQHLWEMMGLDEQQREHLLQKRLSAKKRSVSTINLNSVTKIHESLAHQLNHPDSPESLTPTLNNLEMTTYRSEGVYEDHRRPSKVEWGKTIEEDLSRRDFTVNAMALRINAEKLTKIFGKKTPTEFEFRFSPNDYIVLDPYDGQKDLATHHLRTVGVPSERFQEDALRMLRAIRFSVQLNLKMSDEVFAAIALLAEDILHVSWERIRDEFLKMLKSPYPAEAIELLDETGLLHFLLPELREGKGVEQGGHHITDVWTHSIDALRNCPSPDPVVRFATLLHDIAKPRTFRITDDGNITFYNHEIIGARVAKKIAQRFRLSNHDCDRVFALVRYHMFYYQPHNTDSAIRRFMRNVGLENINDILDLREGDRLGSGARKTSWRLEEMKDRMVAQLHQPFAITDLAINGDDLIKELGLKPGPVIGKILHTLFEKVLDNPELNEREKLLEEAKQILLQ